MSWTLSFEFLFNALFVSRIANKQLTFRSATERVFCWELDSFWSNARISFTEGENELNLNRGNLN